MVFQGASSSIYKNCPSESQQGFRRAFVCTPEPSANSNKWIKFLITIKATVLGSLIGRGDRIRTCGLFVPNEALYQAEPHLEVIFTAFIVYQISFILSSRKMQNNKNFLQDYQTCRINGFIEDDLPSPKAHRNLWVAFRGTERLSLQKSYGNTV